MMAEKKVAQYGTWTSPLTAERFAEGGVELGEVCVDRTRHRIYYVETRPASGKATIVQYDVSTGQDRDVLPVDAYDVSSQVHSYGGGALALVSATGSVVFTDRMTSAVYLYSPADDTVKRITKPNHDIYYADFCPSPHEELLQILAIQEFNHGGKSSDVINRLVVINASTGDVLPIVEGADFYARPRFSPDGSHVCWIQWNQPGMPWTGSELYVGRWTGEGVVDVFHVAGQPVTESVEQPRWSPGGHNLFYCSDLTGFWQLYAFDTESRNIRRLGLRDFEDGEFAGPDSFLGNSSFDCLTNDKLVACWTKDATQRVVVIDLLEKTCSLLQGPSINARRPIVHAVSATEFCIIGSTPTEPESLLLIDVDDPLQKTVIKSSSTLDFPQEYCSIAEHISFPSSDTSNVSHAFYLPPKNPLYTAPEGTPPPLLIWMHGGPTSHEHPGLKLEFQYWTTRGYAVAALNYTGSSGYGRAYRKRLNGKWGILDVEDAVSCVQHLVKLNKVDSSRIGIFGRSAGGYAVLQALTAYPHIWAGGVDLFGISEFKSLLNDTHKFEERYVDYLLFGEHEISEEEKEKVLRERSPLHHADRIRTALLILQGDADNVVPPEQAKIINKVIQENGGTARLVLLPGEGHGFKQAGNKYKAQLEMELWWEHTLVKKASGSWAESKRLE